VPTTGIDGVVDCPTKDPLPSNTRTVKVVSTLDWLQIANEIRWVASLLPNAMPDADHRGPIPVG